MTQQDQPVDATSMQQIAGLFRAEKVISAAINDDIKSTGLDAHDLIILGLLKNAHGYTMPISDITDSMFVPKSVTSHRVQRLERLGLIVRSEMPEDRRRTAIVLTAKGQRVYQVGHDMAMASVRNRLGRFLSEDDFLFFQRLNRVSFAIARGNGADAAMSRVGA